MALILNNLSKLSASHLIIIVLLSLQVVLLQAQSLEVSASGSACLQDCGPGYQCVSGKCERKICNINCNNQPDELVCGSNGNTFKNRCEIDKENCESGTTITVEYTGACITLPPPPENLCKAHQRRFDQMPLGEYRVECNYMDIQQKAAEGTLTINDVIDCYRPNCDGEKYARRQCSYNSYFHCWCSSEDGFVIPDTFEKDKPMGACDQRKACVVDGVTHKDGAIFSPPSGCGFCECLNGEHVCFESYAPDVNGYLTSSQLTLLKQEVTHVFNFQYNHDEHILVDIRHIHQHPTEVSDKQKAMILEWKFNHYDRNSDGMLRSNEKFIFQTELYDFIRCSSFFDHVTELMDEDTSGTITFEEWTRFFSETSSGSSSGSTSSESSAAVPDVSSTPVKRSVPASAPVLRKPLNLRKKFRYVLS